MTIVYVLEECYDFHTIHIVYIVDGDSVNSVKFQLEGIYILETAWYKPIFYAAWYKTYLLDC